VTVVPKGVEITGAARSLSQHDYQIDVGVQKKVGADLEADVAGLCGWWMRSPCSCAAGL